MKNMNGFTLVELMVAILVLAIGLLGLAGLQATSLSGNHNAYLRTQATLLAQDMADRMRDNRGALDSYLGGGCTPPQDTPLSGIQGCTATQVEKATNDLVQWNQALATQLPGGTGKVTQVSAGVYNISITWIERENTPQNPGGTVERAFDMSFQP